MVEIPFDVFERSADMEKIVMRGDYRLYYRFRHSKDFYNGIVTGDAVGCNLLCACCWNFQRNFAPQEVTAKLYRPQYVARRLENLANKHNCPHIRISGAEPFLGELSSRHILNILKNVKKDVIIETNGIMLGAHPQIVEKLAKCRNIEYVRIDLKGHDASSFEKITGAKGEAWQYQQKAIVACRLQRVPLVVSSLAPLVDEETVQKKYGDVEIEDMYPYRGVKGRLKNRGL